MAFVVHRSCFCLTNMVHHYSLTSLQQLIRLSHLSLMSWSRIIASLIIKKIVCKLCYVKCVNVDEVQSTRRNWLWRNTKEIWAPTQIDLEEIEKKSESKYKLTLWSPPAAWPVRYRPQPSISELKCKHKLALSYHHYSSSIIPLSHHDNHLKEGSKNHHHHPKLCLCQNMNTTKLNSMVRGHESPHI